MVETLSRGVAELARPRVFEALIAAEKLSQARRIYCAGLRSAYPVAYQSNYLHTYFSREAMLLDAPGEIGADKLERAGPQDSLLVVSMEPCARRTVELGGVAPPMRWHSNEAV
jgi:DNA-binding MurR/RpiR family transcriptional regulator